MTKPTDDATEAATDAGLGDASTGEAADGAADEAVRKALSGLPKANAPATFATSVTATIHKRSAGRFFARRTFGDRVPFGALAIVALVALAVLGYVMWSSQTGSLARSPEPAPVSHGSGLPLAP